MDGNGNSADICSILDDLAAAFPPDMPDLKESTDHLKPLNLPAQIGLYFPGREGRLGFQDSPEAPIVRAERRRLRDWLSTNIPVQWGKHVKEIEHNEQGVSVHFEDGTSANGDILVGADGIHSVGMYYLDQPLKITRLTWPGSTRTSPSTTQQPSPQSRPSCCHRWRADLVRRGLQTPT